TVLLFRLTSTPGIGGGRQMTHRAYKLEFISSTQPASLSHLQLQEVRNRVSVRPPIQFPLD
ncbi:hypothetical protein ACFLRX_09620, partial [Acidobacteriota bacterium]